MDNVKSRGGIQNSPRGEEKKNKKGRERGDGEGDRAHGRQSRLNLQWLGSPRWNRVLPSLLLWRLYRVSTEKGVIPAKRRHSE